MSNCFTTSSPIYLPFDSCSLEIVIMKPDFDFRMTTFSFTTFPTVFSFLKKKIIKVIDIIIPKKSAIGAAHKGPSIPKNCGKIITK